MCYEAVNRSLADLTYNSVCAVTRQEKGQDTKRKCGTNAAKTCMCQGSDESEKGLSYTFGCSTSLYPHTYCKFGKAKDGNVRKFRLDNHHQQSDIEVNLDTVCSNLADWISPVHKKLAPDCHQNMAMFGNQGCRVGKNAELPYSGATVVVDFCAHAHKDDSNMVGGCTAIVTLTKESRRGQQEMGEDKEGDVQYHCLPLYKPVVSDR